MKVWRLTAIFGDFRCTPHAQYPFGGFVGAPWGAFGIQPMSFLHGPRAPLYTFLVG